MTKKPLVFISYPTYTHHSYIHPPTLMFIIYHTSSFSAACKLLLFFSNSYFIFLLFIIRITIVIYYQRQQPNYTTVIFYIYPFHKLYNTMYINKYHQSINQSINLSLHPLSLPLSLSLSQSLPPSLSLSLVIISSPDICMHLRFAALLLLDRAIGSSGGKLLQPTWARCTVGGIKAAQDYRVIMPQRGGRILVSRVYACETFVLQAVHRRMTMRGR